MKLSIVTTLYNSAGSLTEFVRRISEAARQVADTYEIVIVDDGSPDNSLEVVLGLGKADPHLKVIELSRNFGHHKALMTGLMHASGEYVFMIDSDLEEQPEWLLDFWNEMKATDHDVIFGFQRERRGSFLRKMSGSVAYWLIDTLIPYKIPHNHITVRLMSRDYVQSLIRHREQQTVIGGLWVITGFRQRGIARDKGSRKASTYRFFHRMRVMIDSVTSFSEAPLVFIFYLGLAISLVAGIYALGLVGRWLFGGITVAGWLSVMVSLWLIGGILIFSVGVLGIYLAKIFIETKNRPYTIVRRVHQVEPVAGGCPTVAIRENAK